MRRVVTASRPRSVMWRHKHTRRVDRGGAAATSATKLSSLTWGKVSEGSQSCGCSSRLNLVLVGGFCDASTLSGDGFRLSVVRKRVEPNSVWHRIVNQGD